MLHSGNIIQNLNGWQKVGLYMTEVTFFFFLGEMDGKYRFSEYSLVFFKKKGKKAKADLQIVFYLFPSLEQKMFHFKEKHSKRRFKKRAWELCASRSIGSRSLRMLSRRAEKMKRMFHFTWIQLFQPEIKMELEFLPLHTH